MLAGDRDFGLFFVVHFEHEAGFEPGDDFLDVMDVDVIGAMRAPEGLRIEGGEELFEGAVIGSAFGVFGEDGDEAAFDGGENEVGGIDEKHALLRPDKDFGRLRGGGLGSSELGDELFEALGGAGVGVDFPFNFLESFGDARSVERLQYVIHRIYIERLHGVVVKGGGENDVRDFKLALDELFEDAEAVEARHLDVEEDEVGVVLFDEVDGVETVFALGEEMDFGEGFEEEGEFFAGRLLVVDDDGGDGHGWWTR